MSQIQLNRRACLCRAPISLPDSVLELKSSQIVTTLIPERTLVQGLEEDLTVHPRLLPSTIYDQVMSSGAVLAAG